MPRRNSEPHSEPAAKPNTHPSFTQPMNILDNSNRVA